MRTKLFTAILVTILSAFIFSSVFASSIGVTTILEDDSTDFSYTSWLPTSAIGRGGSHQYFLYVPGVTGNPYGKWSTTGSTTSSTNYKWWVWIPYNLDYSDAAVSYTVRNTEEEFPVTVNQENHADTWVFLGWAYGTGYIPWSYINMENDCVPGFGCNQYYQVWWDDAKYYPCRDAGGTGDCTSG